MHRSLFLLAPIALACAALLSPSSARAQAFLFEDVAQGNYPNALSVTSGAQTLTLTPEGFPDGSIAVTVRDSPLYSGVVANRGAFSEIGGFTPLRFTFSSPVDAITFGFEDATQGSGGDIDGTVTIDAFSSSDTLLGSLVYNNPAYDGGTYQTLSGSFGAASYFIARSPAPQDNMHSLVYEVVSSTPGDGTPAIPEPGSMALLAAGIPALMAFRRKR